MDNELSRNNPKIESNFDLLEEQFSSINDAILNKHANLVVWLSSGDIIVTTIQTSKGKTLGYAEHFSTLDALLEANKSLQTGEHFSVFDIAENEVQVKNLNIHKDTFLDNLIKHCGKIKAREVGGLVEVTIRRYADQFEEVPDEVRRYAYEKGEVLWENRGYIFRVIPAPRLHMRTQPPISFDQIQRLPGRDVQDDFWHYKMQYQGKGPTFLTALVEAYKDEGVEINHSNKHLFK